MKIKYHYCYLFIGALAIWAMVIIESRRKIISIKKEHSHENT